MTYSDRKLDNPINWSFHVFRVFAIDVRVHITFVIGAFVLIAMELPDRGSSGTVAFGKVIVDALGTYAILFFIVLVHEFGHCFGARHVGGEANEILIWPLGGLAYVQPPHEPRAHMITTLAGPMVNVIFCAIGSVALVLWVGHLGAVPWNPLHPTSPVSLDVVPTLGQVWLMRFFGISYVILIINMFPIFPFDGGRVLQAWLWPRKGYGRSMEIATGTGMVGAIVIGVFGLLSQEYLLMMIAVFGYLTCWQTRRVLKEQGEFEAGFGAEFGGGYSFGADGETRPRKLGYFARRKKAKQEARVEREVRERKERKRLVEDALRRVSESGLDSLTPKQRMLLEEETQRRRAVDSNSE